MSSDPRLDAWNNESSIYYERPLHMLSQASKDTAIKRHLTSKNACQAYLERLKVYEKENVKGAIDRMLALCDVDDDELYIFILTEFHRCRK